MVYLVVFILCLYLVIMLFLIYREDQKKNVVKWENAHCNFKDGISKKQFENMVRQAYKSTKRLTALYNKGTVVYGTVKSQSGLTEWHFNIDFNDCGYITGQYWINSDNDDSDIPEKIAQIISLNIVSFLVRDGEVALEDGNHANVHKENMDYEDYRKMLGIIRSKAEIDRKHERKRKTIKKIMLYFILAILIFLIGIVIFAYYKYTEHQKSIEVGISSTYAVGKDYQTIVNALENNGFTNIHTYPDYDLEYENISQENIISEIEIHGKDFFDESSKYPYDSNIYIKYHMVKNICVPISAKEAKKMNYNELIKLLSESGFVNIKTQAEYDLITGWINKDGFVDEITINGETKFTKNSTYRPDVEILITYHTFEKNNDK